MPRWRRKWELDSLSHKSFCYFSVFVCVGQCVVASIASPHSGPHGMEEISIPMHVSSPDPFPQLFPITPTLTSGMVRNCML